MKPLLFLMLLQLPEGRGRDAVMKACGTCHGVEAVIGNHNTRKGWTELVDEMIFRGASVTRAQRRDIIDYLTRNFPMRH
jgi:hypothetical protein